MTPTPTTTPTSGAADLPEALRSIQRFEVVDCIDDKHVPAVIPNPHGPWVRYEDHIAALAAGQATAPQQAVERVYAFRRKGLEDFCTCDEARYEELSNKPHLFETRVFYTAPQPSPTTQADSVQEDAARLDFIQECGATVEILPGRLGWTFRVGGPHGGVHGSVRAAIDAERQAFLVHGMPELHAAPTHAQAGALPLTPERVKEIVRGAGYDQCGIPDTERAAFINGLRHGEREHGIKGGQHD